MKLPACIPAFLLVIASAAAQPAPVPSTGQTRCYNATSVITPPAAGQPFSGQDAQQASRHTMGYTISGDSLTVLDKVTHLTWQRGADTNGDGRVTPADKLTHAQALLRPAALNAMRFGGFDDWRLPTIRELYSLITFVGTDPNPNGSSTVGLVPFIDTTVFAFAYGDPAAGERIIDAQYASATTYTARTMGNNETAFGVNFADGRIKGYPKGTSPGGQPFRSFVLCVRGTSAYDSHAYIDNGDSTVTDRATGLMWAKEDQGVTLNWQDALAHAAAMNARHWLGYDDWRLPHVKELQSIVDYTRSPAFSGTAAIDPVFGCTAMTNEAGQEDWGCYWSSTTHASQNGQGAAAAYVAFGRGMGFMNGAWIDVHGAGCQRSDPKAGDPAQFPQGRGPQGDAIRILNRVRLVRDAAGATGALDARQRHPELELAQNWPNPVTSSTTISYAIPAAAHVRLTVTDLLGREVAVLVDAWLPAGVHAAHFDAAGAGRANGIWLYRLDAGQQSLTRMMVRARHPGQ